MSFIMLTLIVLALGAIGFVLGRRRAMARAGGNARQLHSLPVYYGAHVGLNAVVPALALLAVWMIAYPLFVDLRISGALPEAAIPDSGTRSLVMSDVRRVSDGLETALATGALSQAGMAALQPGSGAVRDLLGSVGVALGSDVTPEVLAAAQDHRALTRTGGWIATLAVLGLSLGGLALSLARTTPAFRARNVVEQGIKALLITAASLAILTTAGIIFSLIFNTIEFFRLHSAADFFFGTTWSPSFGGGSSLGVLPLLWGTLYISLIALLVAVPIGLFAAVYLSEYASARVRAFAKPMIEVLAGIPTIVYGLFALLTVGPLLVSVFGEGGVGIMQAGTAVMTAGLVMGVMLIPFVSSLSDDIINAVPQAMRDGSYGLGATKSETIRQVILPAALPGIVGAILLAASRAIGETMIVVLGAGAAARLSLNPFDAMTTVTAKIVSQLTGDADFASPEALVAFALGMTLFVITLGLNVFALYIVRKYREQYE